jgi:hypothetical protein
MGAEVETVVAAAAVVVEVVVVRLVAVPLTVVLDEEVVRLVVFAGGLLRRRGAPVFMRPVLPPLLVLTLALTEAAGRPVINAPRTPSSSSCA